jgi:hypothetical protein
MAASSRRAGDEDETSQELSDEVFGALMTLLERLPDDDVPRPGATDLEAWRIGYYRWLDSVLCRVEGFDPEAVSRQRAQGAEEWAAVVRRRMETLVDLRDDGVVPATPRRRELVGEAIVWLEQQLAFLEAVVAEAGSAALEEAGHASSRPDAESVARIERALDLWINPARAPRREDADGER